jgi:alpha-amylase
VSDGGLALCFGVHNHQPVGNFDEVVAEAAERAYRPFFERLTARPEVRVTVHCTGSLLEWLRERSPATFDRLGALAARGQVELLTGGFYEPILAVLPEADRIGQVQRLTEFLKTSFGVRPRGMWLAERVWEPELPGALRAAGVEYVLVDDSHFALTGMDPETLGGYYLTEDQGALIGVFPISQRLRYLIPFGTVDENLEYLASRREAGAVTVVDDGEKFGVWPGTHAHVYTDGWLDRFFDAVLATPWLRLATFADVFDGTRARGPVYLPTASYREMGEWALPAAAALQLEDAKRALARLPDGGAIARLLQAGFWRNFLVKYAEVGDVYWKMLRLSHAIAGELVERPDDVRLGAARTALWRGQANDAYWHGVFGGCYLPHLRRAVKGSLLEAERLLAETTTAGHTGWWQGDGNGDGRVEIYVRTAMLSVAIHPDAGGSVTELGYLPRGVDVGDVLTRRPEAYHARLRDAHGRDAVETARTIHEAPGVKEPGLDALLTYDELRRASLVEGVIDPGAVVDPVSPWSAARFCLGRAGMKPEVATGGGGITVSLRPWDDTTVPLLREKVVTVDGDTVAAMYGLRGGAAETQWAVQWNLALTGGDAPGRYFTLAGRPSLGSTGRRADVTEFGLVDEWIGMELRLTCSPSAEVTWGPVETVSLSEGGFERIYQGTSVVLLWSVPAGQDVERRVSLTVMSR